MNSIPQGLQKTKVPSRKHAHDHEHGPSDEHKYSMKHYEVKVLAPTVTTVGALVSVLTRAFQKPNVRKEIATKMKLLLLK